MVEKSKEKRANEQAKAQNLFARWRKEETLYSEDEKKERKKQEKQQKENKQCDTFKTTNLWQVGSFLLFLKNMSTQLTY